MMHGSQSTRSQSSVRPFFPPLEQWKSQSRHLLHLLFCFPGFQLASPIIETTWNHRLSTVPDDWIICFINNTSVLNEFIPKDVYGFQSFFLMARVDLRFCLHKENVFKRWFGSCSAGHNYYPRIWAQSFLECIPSRLRCLPQVNIYELGWKNLSCSVSLAQTLFRFFFSPRIIGANLSMDFEEARVLMREKLNSDD